MKQFKKLSNFFMISLLMLINSIAVASNHPAQTARVRLINLTNTNFYANYYICNNAGQCSTQPLALVPSNSGYFDVGTPDNYSVYVHDVENNKNQIIGGPYPEVMGSCWNFIVGGANSALIFQNLTGIIICYPAGGKL